MGKKGSWFSAIKRVFTPNSKEKQANESEKRSWKERKKGMARLRDGDTNSFIPLFRKPSSIEKILGDAEIHQQSITFRPPTPPSQPETPFLPPRLASPRAASPRPASPTAVAPRAASPRPASPTVGAPRTASPRAGASRIVHHHRPEPTLRYRNVSATKIQAAYRGYMARRSFRALKGLVRLQGVIRGQNVKRQTMSAMKYMQLLVRIQSQIQSRRIQTLENQTRFPAQHKNDKEVEGSLNKWNLSPTFEVGNGEEWDDSVLTQKEVEARFQKKVEAVIKRERAMAYAYSHKLWKDSPKSALKEIQSGGFPWWWNWLERQLPPTNPPESQSIRSFNLTPPRPISEPKPIPRPQSSKHKKQHFPFDNIDGMTPKSSKTPLSARIPPANSPRIPNYSRPRASGTYSPFDVPLKDDDSLTSCPPFSAPNYMSPTVSAKAKVRAGSNPKERFPHTPTSESNRRTSFPLAQGIGSFKWNKGSFFPHKRQTVQSVENMSEDSTVSMPAGVGRKPFNRFV